MHAKARATMFFRRACELGDAKVSSGPSPPPRHVSRRARVGPERASENSQALVCALSSSLGAASVALRKLPQQCSCLERGCLEEARLLVATFFKTEMLAIRCIMWAWVHAVALHASCGVRRLGHARQLWHASQSARMPKERGKRSLQ